MMQIKIYIMLAHANPTAMAPVGDKYHGLSVYGKGGCPAIKV
jgi:hypothetical protein